MIHGSFWKPVGGCYGKIHLVDSTTGKSLCGAVRGKEVSWYFVGSRKPLTCKKCISLSSGPCGSFVLRELANEMTAVADRMSQLADSMRYYAGFNSLLQKHAREVSCASALMRDWAKEVQKENK